LRTKNLIGKINDAAAEWQRRCIGASARSPAPEHANNPQI